MNLMDHLHQTMTQMMIPCRKVTCFCRTSEMTRMETVQALRLQMVQATPQPREKMRLKTAAPWKTLKMRMVQADLQMVKMTQIQVVKTVNQQQVLEMSLSHQMKKAMMRTIFRGLQARAKLWQKFCRFQCRMTQPLHARHPR